MSETTKRIEEIYKDIEKLMLRITDKHDPHWQGFVEEAKAIATHLHQEVIRGKIEELEKISSYMKLNLTSKQDIRNRLADLERQIKEETNALQEIVL